MLKVMVEGVSVSDLFDEQASPHSDSSCLAELVGSEHTTIVSFEKIRETVRNQRSGIQHSDLIVKTRSV